MKYLVCLGLICVFGQLAFAAPSDSPVDCSKLEEIVDDRGSAQSITFMNDKYPMPGTLEEYNARCRESEAALKTLKEYNSKCNTALTKQVFSAILKTRTEFLNKNCKLDAPETKEAADACKCLKDNSPADIKDNEKKTLLNIQVLHEKNIPEDKLRLRHACCGVLASRTSFLNVAKQKCSKYDALYTDYVDSYMAEAMGLICPDAKELDCDKLEQIKSDGVEPKSKFFLSPMMKVVKTLDHN